MRCRISWSLPHTAYWLSDEDRIGWFDELNFLLETSLEYLYVYCALSLLKGRLHLVRDTAAEKEFDIAIQMTLEHISSEIQENRNGRKN